MQQIDIKIAEYAKRIATEEEAKKAPSLIGNSWSHVKSFIARGINAVGEEIPEKATAEFAIKVGPEVLSQKVHSVGKIRAERLVKEAKQFLSLLK